MKSRKDAPKAIDSFEALLMALKPYVAPRVGVMANGVKLWINPPYSHNNDAQLEAIITNSGGKVDPRPSNTLFVTHDLPDARTLTDVLQRVFGEATDDTIE